MAQIKQVADWAPQFKSFLSSPLGIELIKELGRLRMKQLQEAETANPDRQSALLNQGYGVRLALEHLQFLSIVPKDEGSKAN